MMMMMKNNKSRRKHVRDSAGYVNKDVLWHRTIGVKSSLENTSSTSCVTTSDLADCSLSFSRVRQYYCKCVSANTHARTQTDTLAHRMLNFCLSGFERSADGLLSFFSPTSSSARLLALTRASFVSMANNEPTQAFSYPIIYKSQAIIETSSGLTLFHVHANICICVM